ncbi:hypothetical protein CPC08DRAFT_24385 [Agrocybe pediades]|nr:hypothetical protein CPC08DRAFT_24385 [Agrocybe pediades]
MLSSAASEDTWLLSFSRLTREICGVDIHTHHLPPPTEGRSTLSWFCLTFSFSAELAPILGPEDYHIFALTGCRMLWLYFPTHFLGLRDGYGKERIMAKKEDVDEFIYGCSVSFGLYHGRAGCVGLQRARIGSLGHLCIVKRTRTITGYRRMQKKLKFLFLCFLRGWKESSWARTCRVKCRIDVCVRS